MADFPNVLDTPSSGGGAYTLIDSYSQSNVANLSITNIPATYSSLLFIIDVMTLVSGIRQPSMVVSINNGSSYLNTNEYDHSTTLVNGATGTAQGLTAQAQIRLCYNALVMDSGSVGFSMTHEIFNYNLAVANGTAFHRWSYNTAETGTSQVMAGVGSAFSRITSAIDAFQIYMGASNINIDARLYGMT